MYDAVGAQHRIGDLLNLYIGSAFPLRSEALEAERNEAIRRDGVVSREPLGSVGIPLKVAVEGDKSVFVCCQGCEEMVRSNPAKMLARLPELQARVKAEQAQAGTGPVEAPPEQPAEPVVEPAPQEPESAPKPTEEAPKS